MSEKKKPEIVEIINQPKPSWPCNEGKDCPVCKGSGEHSRPLNSIEKMIGRLAQKDLLSRLTAPEMVEAVANKMKLIIDIAREENFAEASKFTLRLIAERLDAPQTHYVDDLKKVSQEAGEKYRKIQKELEDKLGGRE